MKKTFLKFVIIEFFILIVAMVILFANAFSYKKKEVDIVKVNSYLQTAKENWEDKTWSESALSKDRVLILGADEQVLYNSDKEYFKGINSETDAIKKGMLVLSVTDNDTFLGNLIISNPANESYNRSITRIIIITTIIIIIIALSFLSFLWYVERNVVKPFRRMKEFAGAVAKGNLDEPLLIEKNNMFGLFSESFDMMREELKASRNREIALKIKEKELVASLSHDLKSPVTGIRLICELLEVKVKDAYTLGKIENIRHKTEEMNVLLSDLLSTALDDLGELNVNCSDVASDVLMKLVDEHDTKKKVNMGEVPGCILFIDQNRLSQVIGNIIGNSYKYADTKIDVSFKYHDKYLIMTIRDYGEGVDAKEIPLLTNKFYRGKKSAADKEGSGLGLFICREIMEKMNGELKISSEDGFAVTLMLPLA